MKLLAVVALLLVSFRDEKKELKEAAENTAALQSYFYQKRVEFKVMGRARPQAGAGEYVAPDVLTYRTSIFEAARKGEKVMFKDRDQWEELTDKTRSPYARDAKNLKPPHQGLADFFANLESPRRDSKGARIGEEKFTLMRARLSGDALKEALKALGAGFGNLERVVDYGSSRLDVEILLHPRRKVVRKIHMTGKIAVSSPLGDQESDYTRTLEFMEWDTAKPGLAPEVKKALGIEDPVPPSPDDP